MNRKGAITIFVIIGLLLVIGAGYFMYMLQETQEINLEEVLDEKDATLISSHVQSCLEASVQGSTVKLLAQGFYYEPELQLITYDVLSNNVGLPETRTDNMQELLDGNKNKLPSKKQANENFALIIQDSFQECFSQLETDYLDLSFGKAEVITNMKEMTKIELHFPVTVTDGESKQTVSIFSTVLTYDLISKYEFLKEFLEISARNQAIALETLTNYCYTNEYTSELISLTSTDVGIKILIADYEVPLTLKFIGRFY